MSKERILVVEDEPHYQQYIRAVLRASGYGVLTADDGEAAVAAAASETPTLILLDVRLPQLDGVAACRRIREFSTVPIIMLTALAQPADIVAGLEAGADDYITKPFTTEILLARLRANLRRAAFQAAPSREPVFETGQLVVDYARRQVTMGGAQVHLTPTEYQLLVVLARAADQVVVSSAIVEQVWGPDHAGGEDMVRRIIHRLRRKLEPDPAAPRYIVTEGRMGYVLNRQR